MPDDPNKAEELLKRYAKERRERGGDFSLHPATRRMLQGEVRRQLGAPQERASWLAWFGVRRNRFAASAALIVIIASVWFFAASSRSSKRQEFAKANSTRIENELLLARTERLAEAKKEPTAPRLNEVAKTEVATRALADGLDIQSKSTRDLARNEALAPAQKPQSALDNVALFSDVRTASTETNAFNYSVSLAPAQNSQNAQGPPTVAASVAQRQEQFLNAAQNTLADNSAAPSQLGAAVANSSAPVAANTALPLSDETKLAKQSNLPLEQRGDVANRAPQSQIISTPANPVLATAPAEKLNRGDLAGLAGSSQIQPGQAPQRFYRSRNAGPENQVAQKTAIDARGGTKAESSDLSGTVLSQFTVEQEGNTMRWRDADGSLYEGTVTAAATAGRGFQTDLKTTAERDKVELLREKAPVQKATDASAGEELVFSVSGSNVTTRQLVTVNGRFAPNTNRLAGAPELLARRLTLQPQPTPQRPSTLSQDSPVMIEGTVRFCGSNEQRFQAVRAPR